MNFFYLKSNTCTYVLTKPGSNYLIQCQNIKKLHCVLKNYSTRIILIGIKVGYACMVYTCVFVFEHYKLFLHSVSQFILVAFVMEKEERLNKL